MNTITTNNNGDTLVNGVITALATNHRAKITIVGSTTMVRWFGGDVEDFFKEDAAIRNGRNVRVTD